VIQRLIGKWLNAGVLEGDAVTRSESGSPQGGVVSPVLANIFLHTVLDVWFHQEVRGRLRGRAHLVRYHYCRKLFHPGQGMRLEVHDLRAGC
jgi:RNA-directed DNA polymerase